MTDENKIIKGTLVRLNVAKCFTQKQGGERNFPLTNYGHDEDGIVRTFRPTTPEEQSAWYHTDEARGMNSAGESKLPPQSSGVSLRRDRVYTVLRARAAVRLGWGNKTGGLVKVLCTESGEETYIKRDLVEVVV